MNLTAGNMRRCINLLAYNYYGRKKRNLDVHVRPLSILVESISHGKPIHENLRRRKQFNVEIGSEGIHRDIYGCNLRISSLGRRGDINGARDLFDQMPQRDVVTYASMINLYLKNGDLPQAEALFQKIPERNVVAESAMIHGLAKAGRIDEARRLFGEMPVRNVFTWTSLLFGYWRAGRVEEAQRVFDQMPEKNVVSWTTMVLGYARNGLLSDARVLFDRMPERNVVSWTAMIKTYVEEGRIEEAGELFDKMPQRNLYSWNIMIKGYLHCRHICRALRLFESMPQRNAVTWTTMVSGLAENDMIDDARNLFDQMPIRDIASWNAMITAYARNWQMDMARNLFDSMPERNIVSWNAMIDGYAKNGSHYEALLILLLMLRSSVKPNETTLTSLLAGCDSMSAGMEIHALATKLAFVLDTSLENALVTMYSRNGELGSAWLAFNELKAKDVVSWTSMILAFANHGCGSYALKAFAKMLSYGVQPDAITFTGLLSACSHAGLVEKGRQIFESMTRAYGVEPKAEHYTCLVDILGRAGRVSEANIVLKQMPQTERDASVLGAMLGACKVHGELETANQIAEDLIELEPSSAGTYVLLANNYASGGKWNDVARVRKMMREQRVEKVSGFSQIDVKMRSHVFFAADRAHSQHEEIYAMIEEVLLPQMKDMDCRQELLSSQH